MANQFSKKKFGAHVGNSVGTKDGRGRAVRLGAPNSFSSKGFKRFLWRTPDAIVQVATILPT
jgi:hypothetical protein